MLLGRQVSITAGNSGLCSEFRLNVHVTAFQYKLTSFFFVCVCGGGGGLVGEELTVDWINTFIENSGGEGEGGLEH